MRKILLFFPLALLIGCTSEKPLSFSEIDNNFGLDKDIETFILSSSEENGIHIYFDTFNNEMFVYLNGSHVIQGEKATYFKNFNVEEDNNTLRIFYESDQVTENLASNQQKLYKINLNKVYEATKVYNNGTETIINTIEGRS